MAAQRITLPDGRECEVEYRDTFETVKEDWNEYMVDGNIHVRFKAVAGRIGLLVDPDTKARVMNDDGTPAVLVVSQNLVISSLSQEGRTH